MRPIQAWNGGVPLAGGGPHRIGWGRGHATSGRNHGTLAREILGMTQAEFSAAFKGSPMKHAKLPGLNRNAAVVLGDPEPLVRGHAGCALGSIGTPEALDALRASEGAESDEFVLGEATAAG